MRHPIQHVLTLQQQQRTYVQAREAACIAGGLQQQQLLLLNESLCFNVAKRHPPKHAVHVLFYPKTFNVSSRSVETCCVCLMKQDN